ncbi:tetratricopeptide repeat protein [Myxococcota bacterium]|nr:tetratricopeptide repeat protein [Myxococcota bacterium]
MKAMNRYEQARECDSRGDYETAALHMKRAIELQPENATFHYLYGAYLGHLCKNARGLRQEELLIEAIQECEIAANLPEGTGVEPDKPHVEPGIILANIGRYEEAVRYLESIEKKTGKTPWFMLSLGGARYLLEDFAGAWDCLQMAIKFFTDDAIALERAGHCCFELGLKKEGAEFLKRANFLGQSRVYDFWQAGGFKTALIQTKR